jgi:hypothetical protein
LFKYKESILSQTAIIGKKYLKEKIGKEEIENKEKK